MYEVYIVIISFLIGAFAMFVYIAVSASLKEEKSNKVHFYVARDKNEELWLYLCKPIRFKNQDFFVANEHGRSITCSYNFKNLGLNENDYKNLTFDDEPVEVFLNLED